MDSLRRVVERNDRLTFELMGPYTNPLWHQLSVVDDCILVDERLAVPCQLRAAVLKWIHCGHPDQEATLNVFRTTCGGHTCIRTLSTWPRSVGAVGAAVRTLNT